MSEGHCIWSTVLLLLLHLKLAPTDVLFLLLSPTYQVQFQQLSSWHFRTESQSRSKSRNCLGKSNPFSAIQFTTTVVEVQSELRSQVTKSLQAKGKTEDEMQLSRSFHITKSCCKSSDKIRYRSPLTKPYLSEGETLNIKGYLQSRPAFYWILLQ